MAFLMSFFSFLKVSIPLARFNEYSVSKVVTTVKKANNQLVWSVVKFITLNHYAKIVSFIFDSPVVSGYLVYTSRII